MSGVFHPDKCQIQTVQPMVESPAITDCNLPAVPTPINDCPNLTFNIPGQDGPCPTIGLSSTAPVEVLLGDTAVAVQVDRVTSVDGNPCNYEFKFKFWFPDFCPTLSTSDNELQFSVQDEASVQVQLTQQPGCDW